MEISLYVACGASYIPATVILGLVLTAVTAYLLGSIPTGFVVARARGVDIRSTGSGNIGATNVLRVLGPTAGGFVLVVDALKGWLAVILIGKGVCALLCPDAQAAEREWFKLAAAVCAVLGHNYTCWLHFKGGKGIATSAGVLLALVPWSLLCILIVWLVVFGIWRFVSLASICASASLPLAAFATGESATIVAVTAGLAALAIYKHRANINRLMEGTEHRLGRKQPGLAGTNK